MNTSLKVIGDGVSFEKSVVRDGAEGVVFATEFLLQLQRLLQTGLFKTGLCTCVEERSVGRICTSETSLLHLEERGSKY